MKISSTLDQILFHSHVVLDIIWISIYCIPSVIVAFFYAIFGHPKKDVKGQTVMVTGSGQGVGRELCLRFARLGCEVICVELLPELNKETLKLIRQAGGKATGYTCDVSDRKMIMKLAEEVKRVDILINNAGIYPHKGVWNATEEEIRTIININFMSQLWTVQAFMPAMKERDSGHIVAISSMAGVLGMPYLHAYSTSKAAVIALMSCLAHELRLEKKQNVKLTTVHPYFIKTRSEVTECVNARIPPLEVKDAVDSIMDGILQELPSFTVPRRFTHMVNATRIYPQTFADMWYETFPFQVEEPKVDVYKTMLKDRLNKKSGTIQAQ